ncbi:O-methyltransferase [Anaplasma bovis]|uniref:O-methyltransferase n=1 Tax=Anaplasma bovis TaxID=186733 RepID=UPI002FEF954A
MRSSKSDEKIRYLSALFGVSEGEILAVHASAPPRLGLAQLDVLEGQFLRLLIKLAGVKTIVEVGTCVGFSAICMAQSLPEDGHIYTIEKNSENVALASKNVENCDLQDKITVLHGNALSELKKLGNTSPYDMMFIDADKASYPLYLDWAESNIRKGGVIAADNVFLFGTIFDDMPKNISQDAYHGMRAFNQALSDRTKYLSSVLPYTDGILVALKIF